MITRREIAPSRRRDCGAVRSGGGSLTRAFAQQRLTQAELLKFDALGNVTLLHVADIHGQLMPVYFREPSINLGVGRGEGAAAASHRRGLSQALRHPGEIRRGLCADVGGFLRAGEILRPHRRPRPARDRGEGGARRARRRQSAAARWRRHLARLARRQSQQRPGHGRLHGAAEARRHDRPLGIHLRRGAGEGADRQASAFRSSRSTCATPNGTSRCSSR